MDIPDEKNKAGNQCDENRMSPHNKGKNEQVEGCLKHYHFSDSPNKYQKYFEMQIASKVLSKIMERAPTVVREIDFCGLQLTEHSVSKDDRCFTLNIDLSGYLELLCATEIIKDITPCKEADVNQFHLKNINFSKENEMEKNVINIMRMSGFKHVRSVMICNGDLTPLMWNELCQLLPHLSELEELNLQNKINIDSFTKGDAQNLLSNLRHCLKIATLNLSNTKYLNDCCRGIMRIHQSPSRLRLSSRPTADVIIHEHLI